MASNSLYILGYPPQQKFLRWFWIQIAYGTRGCWRLLKLAIWAEKFGQSAMSGSIRIPLPNVHRVNTVLSLPLQIQVCFRPVTKVRKQLTVFRRINSAVCAFLGQFAKIVLGTILYRLVSFHDNHAD